MAVYNHFWGHLHTILLHKKEVFLLCKKCGIPLQGILHDMSKFSPQEFWPGVKYWTGDASPQVGERKYNGYSEAWLHHKGRNKHHFEYWTDYVEGKGVCPIQMPNKWFVEMVCDRIAASKVYLGNRYKDSSPLEYYYKARNHYFIHETTAKNLESVLIYLAENGEDKTADYIKRIYIKRNKNYTNISEKNRIRKSAEVIVMNVITIGIAGGTGSGKTTITKRIVGEFGDNVTVINYDNYYKAHNDMTYEERSKLNYDHPDAFDTELFLEDLRALKEGKSVYGPTYDFTIHNRSTQTILLKPAKVIVVEGILIFASKQICDLLDIKLFVDTDADERIIRRILRDVKSRGRTLESVTDQYLTTVKPMHEQFVEPSKRCADIIVLGGGHNIVALEMIFDRIRNHLIQ